MLLHLCRYSSFAPSKINIEGANIYPIIESINPINGIKTTPLCA